MRKLPILISVTLVLLFVQACFPPKIVKLSIITKSFDLIIGESRTIEYVLDPVDSSVDFSTSDNSIASVSLNGEVSAISVGQTVIAIEATKDGYKKAQGAVTIKVTSVPEYAIAFEVSDQEGPANGANVAFNSDMKLTDENGRAIFSGVLRGNRQYTVSKSGYEDAAGTVNVDSDKTVDVYLSRKMYTLDIKVTGGGTVTKSPDKLEYSYGEEVLLTALPDQGWNFVGWTGDLTGSDSSKVIVMDQNRSVTATFVIETYTIMATAGPGGAIEPEGQIQVNHGDDKEFIISSRIGYEIVDVVADGVSVGAVANYTFNNVVSDHTIEASFSLLEYTITVSASPAEGGTVSGGGVYKHGEQVNLAAQAKDSYRFVNWTENGNELSTDPEYSIIAASNRQLVANFAEKNYELTIIVSGQGTIQRDPAKAFYSSGEIVKLTAIPEVGWRFKNWSGALGGNANPAYITMNSNRTVTGNFSRSQYSIVLSRNPTDGGTTTGGGVYYHGDVVTVKATANDGFEFFNWTEGGNEVSTDTEYSFVASGDRMLIANFRPMSYDLVLQTSGEGSVKREPDKTLYTHGESVRLTAIPKTGWSLDFWSGDLEGTDNPTEIVMDSNKSIAANFARNQYAVKLSVEPEEGGTVAGGGIYLYGDQVTVTAHASECFLFAGWYEDGLPASESQEYSFFVDREWNLIASFEKSVLSKSFVFVLDNMFLGSKYEVTLSLRPGIDEVRFVYPDIDPTIQTPVPHRVTVDMSGEVHIPSFWTNSEAESVIIQCFIEEILVSICKARLLKE
ncbi:hypothetical protein [uncultured Mesotoga sp.]|uniref:InlB B-repeat-containing protein n=1 Tax=uncultured Mesotoga sp. TaxID=1184400 RepID=UPI002594C084|nr:hypothetical protein [uncultured Mesotoga sp.]